VLEDQAFEVATKSGSPNYATSGCKEKRGPGFWVARDCILGEAEELRPQMHSSATGAATVLSGPACCARAASGPAAAAPLRRVMRSRRRQVGAASYPKMACFEVFSKNGMSLQSAAPR
jgi:hypothetical protein